MTQKHTPDTLDIKDLTPLELRGPLLLAMLDHIPFDGWTLASLNAAALDIGVTREIAELAYPSGPLEVLDSYFEVMNDRLKSELNVEDLPAMKIRDRITRAVRLRMDHNGENKELTRRTFATLALPQNVKRGLSAMWATADTMWVAAGDTSTDHNWYTKRMILSGVYSSVLVYWLSDESENYQDTWDFLDRRIEDVMKIETAKYKMRQNTARLPSLPRFLGRLRYPR